MELKHVVVPSQLPYVVGFNRTFMELKHWLTEKAEDIKAVLIGPSWN